MLRIQRKTYVNRELISVQGQTHRKRKEPYESGGLRWQGARWKKYEEKEGSGKEIGKDLS